MRIFKYLFPVVAAAVLFAGCDEVDVVEYNNKIVTEQEEIFTAVEAFYNSLDGGSAEQVRDSYDEMLNQIDSSIVIVQKMEPVKEDASFRDAALGLFMFYQEYFEDEYVKVVEIFEKGRENITEEDWQTIMKIDQNFAEEEEPVHTAFLEAQKIFAEKHDMELR